MIMHAPSVSDGCLFCCATNVKVRYCWCGPTFGREGGQVGSKGSKNTHSPTASVLMLEQFSVQGLHYSNINAVKSRWMCTTPDRLRQHFPSFKASVWIQAEITCTVPMLNTIFTHPRCRTCWPTGQLEVASLTLPIAESPLIKLLGSSCTWIIRDNQSRMLHNTS